MNAVRLFHASGAISRRYRAISGRLMPEPRGRQHALPTAWRRNRQDPGTERRYPAGVEHGAQPLRVVVCAGQYNADQSRPKCVGGRFEQHIDRGPRKINRFVGRERKPASSLDQKMVAGWSKEDRAASDRLLVVGFSNIQLGTCAGDWRSDFPCSPASERPPEPVAENRAAAPARRRIEHPKHRPIRR